MELPQSNTLIPVYSYTRTELLSLRTKSSLLSLSTVDRLKDLNIGYHLPRRHRSSRGVKRKEKKFPSFIVASFNAQSVKGNDMACKRCEISTFIKDNGVDLFFVTETWLSAQGDEAKTAELAPSGFDVKSFPRQSRSRGGGIATVYKSTLGSNITFKTNFDFTHTSFEVVQASITLQHNTLHFFCMYRPPPNRRNNLTDSMFTEQLPDLLDYVNSLPGFVCLVGDMNIHFDNPLQSLTKQTLSTLSFMTLSKSLISQLTGAVISLTGLLFDLTMTSIENLLLQTHLNQTTIALNPTSIFQSISLLPYTGLLGTLLTLTAHHLLLNFPVCQSFHLLKMQTSSVTFCALY